MNDQLTFDDFTDFNSALAYVPSYCDPLIREALGLDWSRWRLTVAATVMGEFELREHRDGKEGFVVTVTLLNVEAKSGVCAAHCRRFDRSDSYAELRAKLFDELPRKCGTLGRALLHELEKRGLTN